MKKIKITRTLTIPNPIQITRYQRHPELGPKLLFFTGGSALTEFCATLKSYTHNSIHLVTPFDSGGSSAKLRECFQMPAIGDLRSRLMALADDTLLGHPEITYLFSMRLPVDESQVELKNRLINLANGEDPTINIIANPMRKLICNKLTVFVEHMPESFDLKGASIGNLTLAGGYINNHNKMDSIIFLFSKLVNVQGIVRAVVNENLHIGAQLQDGTMVLGQHNLTGKEVKPIDSPVSSLFLNKGLEQVNPVTCQLRKENRAFIVNAGLICYPPGSFYTSLIATLLPEGVGRAIAKSDALKVYVPNLSEDPEQFGTDIKQCIFTLIKTLSQDFNGEIEPNKLLDVILVDTQYGSYKGKLPKAKLKKWGIQIIDLPLVSNKSAPYYDNKLLASALLSLSF